MAEDTYSERERQLAQSNAKAGREELVRFYRDMAAMGQKSIPRKMIETDHTDRILSAAESLMKGRLAGIPKEGKGRETGVARVGLAIFLIERTRMLREMAISRNSAGLFSLMIALRDEVRDLLDERYYSMGLPEIAANYSDIEPLLFVLSDSLGIDLPEPGRIMRDYRPKAEKLLG